MKISFLRAIFSITLISILCCPKTTAERFRFRHYEIKDGLPSNTVRTLTQDSRGFMWFGTENGLSRFDGYSFKNFQYTAGSPSSIGSNYIYALYEDPNQNLWVGTDDGVYIYNPESESFSFFDKKTDKGVLIKSYISAIRADQHNNIWISTHAQGIFHYDVEKEQLYQYTAESGTPNATGANMILFVYVDRENTVWAAPQRSLPIINKYDPISRQFTTLELSLPNVDTNDFGVYAMIEDSNHDYWIGTWNHGLCKMDKETGKLEQFIAPGMVNGVSHIHYVTEYEPGLLLVGSDDGLIIFDTRTYESTLMTASELKSSTLSDKFIYPVYKDKEGGLWIGTYYGGVNYAPPTKGDIEGYTHSRFFNSVGGNIISCFCEDQAGNIWVGSDDGGLSCFDPVKETFTNYLPQPGVNSLSYHNIHALYTDKNKLWIGTYSGGLNVFDLQTKRFTHYFPKTDDPSSLLGSSVYSIYKDLDKNLWIGTMERVCLYNPEKDNFIRMKETNTTTTDIIDDRKGNVWFATWGKGLFRYNKEDKSWHHHLYNANDSSSLPSNQVNSLHLDADGVLWFGTDNGLASYNNENNSFLSIPLDIASNKINFIESIDGTLWLATMNGLIGYKPSDKTVRTLSKNDGLLSDQLNVKAGLLSSTGDLYIGTTNGFNRIRPEEIHENNFTPPVFITNIQVFYKDLMIKEKGILRNSILYTDKIELSYKESVFSIEFVSLSYNAPDKNQYKYKLEGFDKEWNYVGNQRKATYTNLPAGSYIFHVMGTNSDGVWNEKEKTLHIVIHPPFWLTTWAYTLYAILFFGVLGYIIYFIRQRAEKNHRRRLRILQHEKEKELQEAKINFFTFVAHEIRTPVSLIIGPLEKIMENTGTMPDVIRDSFNIIDRNSQRLLSLVNQLLDFRKAEEGAFIIQFAQHAMYELLQNVYIRFRPLAEQKSIAITFDMEDHDLKATVDAEAVTKIVSNLLTNAIKHARSKIAIRCYAEDKHVIITVFDDGEGIIPEEQEGIFRPFYQVEKNKKPGTGIGLSLVKLLTDAHKGTIKVDSIPNEQTLFILTLPIEQTIAQPVKISETNVLPDEETEEKQSQQQTTPETVDNDQQKAEKPLLLIVEDNADMREFLQNNLQEHYRTVVVKNGKQGLEQLRKQSVDIIISDVMMPVMDGLTFTNEVKKDLAFSHIPLILLTARTDKDSKLTGMRSGADAYIEKPFSPQLLQAQMENLLLSRKNLRKKFSEMPFIPLQSVVGNKADEKFVTRLNKIIEKNISNTDFSVDVLAEELNISRSGLFAKVKSLVDMTPNELIQLIRLKKAAQLLSEKEFRINEVCYQVGFNNPSYFSKCFQKQFGMLPKDFHSHNAKSE
ncbi:ligand-binding sensor domain-containing protein/signal transduction histidine kinase/DNA-binding response OmpR family regulator [Parabacteroides sp. PFB2-10]|uniref:hybrid sensor histidine kinase/response regulator transcription factor n=1 Tax=Parabacteroides sp. PFB2-10 TaxID=1742405 RepID=UPI0024732508|nr:two-component regulator propeller domain-containing protein [Parabacteroides sp. PFB2-10]MDH6312114.1 ligand-binding sensor domain-containing protein/signal transduction histidine kinase/DNA-binding response OmpR family regulator [Parabacteroides sp. PFB2-10]